MGKNLMPEILKMLGVEYGEKFKLRAEDSEICENALFYFDKDNGFIRMSDTKEEVYNMLYDVVSGYYEIVKLPWEPRYGDIYYIVDARVCRGKSHGNYISHRERGQRTFGRGL